MEYVDGEDLASLLRRIGRIPHDKAVDISRQLCAGLAAAHDRGVVHRDLKPANVMLDGEGNIRITDFGLAIGAADAASAAHAGTPHYMAPEQLKGTPASVKTDIYALGLVLFEIFTGKRAHSARTVAELLELHESGTVQPPSSVVRDLDPFVERVILRCLDKDPDARPGSALAVAAALPGGDPLAAALAAGETPSPEVVAAAGQISALRPLVGLSLVLIVLAGIFLEDRIDDRTLLAARVPMTKSMDGLEDRARDMIVRLGYTMSPGDTASSGAPLRPRGRRSIPGILGPRMLRIPAAQFLSDLWIGPIPEASQIARHLDGSTVRREQRQQHRFALRSDPRRLRQPEQLLKLDRGRDRAVLGILEPHRAAAWNLQRVGRVAIDRTRGIGR